jgi:quinol monooxygenase YgiN
LGWEVREGIYLIIVIAPFKTRRGERDKVIGIARNCIEATRGEPGFISYELFESAEDRETLSFVEKWKDKESLRAHLERDHVKKFFKDRAPYVEGTGAPELFEASPETL